MRTEDEEIHVSDTEASGGSKEGVVRYILLGGLVLAILLLSVTWIVPALMQGDVEEEATVSGELQSMENDGDGTDSIVGTDGSVGSAETELDAGIAETEDDQTRTEDGVQVIEN